MCIGGACQCVVGGRGGRCGSATHVTRSAAAIARQTGLRQHPSSAARPVLATAPQGTGTCTVPGQTSCGICGQCSGGDCVEGDGHTGHNYKNWLCFSSAPALWPGS